MSNTINESQGFAAILEKNLYKIFKERQEFHTLKDMIPKLYTEINDSTRPYEEFISISSLPDLPKFNGKFTGINLYQGYTSKIEPGEYGAVVMSERKLIDDSKIGLIEDIAADLATSANRVREKNSVRIFSNATSIAFDFMKSEEGVSLSSSAHKTKVPGVSTTTGFSNAGTSALTPVSLAAARILMRRFKDSQGERYEVGDNFGIIHPDALSFKVEEIIGTDKGLYSAEGTKNVQKGRYESIPLMRLDDTSATAWGLVDMTTMKKNLMWIQRARAEYKARVDFMTMATEQTCYERHGYGFLGWRWIYWNAA